MDYYTNYALILFSPFYMKYFNGQVIPKRDILLRPPVGPVFTFIVVQVVVHQRIKSLQDTHSARKDQKGPEVINTNSLSLSTFHSLVQRLSQSIQINQIVIGHFLARSPGSRCHRVIGRLLLDSIG